MYMRAPKGSSWLQGFLMANTASVKAEPSNLRRLGRVAIAIGGLHLPILNCYVTITRDEACDTTGTAMCWCILRHQQRGPWGRRTLQDYLSSDSGWCVMYSVACGMYRATELNQ